MTGVDTPDFQRGVVSVQKLLATVPGGSNAQTVGVPPNTATLVAIIPGGPGLPVPEPVAVGETTGVAFPSIPAQITFNGTYYFFTYFDVSQALDANITVSTPTAPGQDWWIYSDGATHVVADLATQNVSAAQDTPQAGKSVLTGGANAGNQYAHAVTQLGQQYVVPSAPSTAAGDHPPVELQVLGAGPIGNQVLLPGPGVSTRYRLFHIQMTGFTSGNTCSVKGSISQTFYCWGLQGVQTDVSFLPSGVALEPAEGVLYSASAPTSNSGVVIVYTTEAV